MRADLKNLVYEVFELIIKYRGRVAFRLDDVGRRSRMSHAVIESLLKKRFEVNLEVVPGWLTPVSVKWLEHLSSGYAGLLEVHQHGWNHTNHEETGKKQEFGAARVYEAKIRELKQGMQKLTTALPDIFFPVFCPPWNRIDAESLAACAALGFSAISAFRGALKELPQGLTDISATVDWSVASFDEPRFLAVLDIICELVLNREDVIIMIHPEKMNEPALETFVEFIDLAEKSGITSAKFSRML